MSGGARSLWQVFRWPTVLALLSLAGLVAALVGDGLWDAFGWAALALPLALCGRAVWLAARRSR